MYVGSFLHDVLGGVGCTLYCGSRPALHEKLLIEKLGALF